MKEKEVFSVPNSMQGIFDEVAALTDKFCREHLNEEYAYMSRKLAAALSRKRPSPLLKGKPDSWACGIVYAIGSVNFLHDKTQTPHMPLAQVCELFGIGKSTAGSRSKVIHDAFDMVQLDPEWTLPSKLIDNPMAWMIRVNGVVVDARHVPLEIQEEAYRLGLIPFVPSKRKG